MKRNKQMKCQYRFNDGTCVSGTIDEVSTTNDSVRLKWISNAGVEHDMTLPVEGVIKETKKNI